MCGLVWCYGPGPHASQLLADGWQLKRSGPQDFLLLVLVSTLGYFEDKEINNIILCNAENLGKYDHIPYGYSVRKNKHKWWDVELYIHTLLYSTKIQKIGQEHEFAPLKPTNQHNDNVTQRQEANKHYIVYLDQ